MSLRTDYFDGATGLNAKLIDAFTEGEDYVADNLTTLSTAILSAAEQGLTKFTVKVTGTGGLNGSYLRANKSNNLLCKSFFAGIHAGLAAEQIFDYECTLTLDVSDTVDTNVNFVFNFSNC